MRLSAGAKAVFASSLLSTSLLMFSGAVHAANCKDEYPRMNVSPDGSVFVGVRRGCESGPNYQSHYVMNRVLPDGTIDTNFGNQGEFRAGKDGMFLPVQLSDGRYLAGGHYFDFDRQIDVTQLYRFEASGALDPTFGIHGVLTITRRKLIGLTVDSDDRIYFTAGAQNPFQGGRVAATMRLDKDGQVDQTFGQRGSAWMGVADPEDPYSSVGYGKIRLGKGGFLYWSVSTFIGGAEPEALMTRYTLDGLFDTSYGEAGYLNIHPVADREGLLDMDTEGRFYWPLIHKEERLLSVGYKRLLPDTSHDSSVTTHHLTVPDDYISYAVGKVAADHGVLFIGPGYYKRPSYVLKFLPSGEPDTAFGSGGVAAVKPQGENEDEYKVVGSDAMGRIYVDGECTEFGRYNKRACVRRLKASGEPDESYGQNSFFMSPLID